MDLRLPRVLTAMVVGHRAWPSPGCTFQGLLRNPLADPYVLGTASGAALGAAIAVLIPVRTCSSSSACSTRSRSSARSCR
jgi:iron complex transport system permease protein